MQRRASAPWAAGRMRSPVAQVQAGAPRQAAKGGADTGAGSGRSTAAAAAADGEQAGLTQGAGGGMVDQRSMASERNAAAAEEDGPWEAPGTDRPGTERQQLGGSGSWGAGFEAAGAEEGVETARWAETRFGCCWQLVYRLSLVFPCMAASMHRMHSLWHAVRVA